MKLLLCPLDDFQIENIKVDIYACIVDDAISKNNSKLKKKYIGKILDIQMRFLYQ